MLNFICALKHEARPIVDHFQLDDDGPGRPFITYRNKNGTISLTITGVGKQAAAAGTSFAIGRFQAGHSDAWLNIGIAGHKELATGTPVLAATITDAADGHIWRPTVNFDSGIVILPLITVDQPRDEYPDHAMIDMEAAGFFSSACKTAASERIHCLKIISDNAQEPAHNISKQKVINLINCNIKVLDELASHFLNNHGIRTAATL